jgi:HlyD family secretion protein
MAKTLLRVILAILILGGVAAAIWHFTRPQPVAVSVKPVTRGTVERTVANTRAGTVKACRRAKLSPSVGGQIADLPIHEGDRVKEGQLLLELWNQDLKAQARLAQYEVNSARSRSRAACAKAAVAQRNADRLINLRRQDVATEERTDNAKAEAAALQAECQAAQAEIDVREAQVAVVEANLVRTRLTAPFDGVIAEINGELFEFSTPSPLGVPTPPAVDIIDDTCFYVSAPIDEVDAADIRVDMPARITLDAFKSRRFAGRVRRIADYVLDVEKQARTVDVEAAFTDKGDFADLLAGYSADVEIILEVRHDVVRVPSEAILDGRQVFVYQPQPGIVQRREIKTGLANWDWTEVLEGLQPDEQVVVNVDNPDLKDQAAAVLLEEAP